MIIIIKKYQCIAAKILTAMLIAACFSAHVFAEDFNLITIASGDSIGDEFCHLATGHGDFNGDGYEDILVGAPGGGESGYAKMFFGSASFDTIPDLVFYGETDSLVYSSLFGSSCAFAGDVNGDGFDDILIGAPEHCIWGLCTGRAYLYYGNDTYDSDPDLIFYGEGLWYRMGLNVSGVGDINNDSYDDWLILSVNTYPTGRIYLYFGSEQPDNIYDVCFVGESYYDVMGFYKPFLGDVNNDGFDDMLLGSASYETYTVTAEIHLGGATIDTVADLLINNSLPDHYFSELAGAGDINNDGYCDWILGQYREATLIYFGSDTLDNVSDLTIVPEPPCDVLGASSACGDIDGDGISDILLKGAIDDGNFTGQVLGFLGGGNLDNQYDYFFDTGISHQNLGNYLTVSDINGDSICEVIAGAYQRESSTHWGPGQIFILSTQLIPSVEITEKNVPQDFRVTSHPNPFNPSTTFSFTLPEAVQVSLTVYDIGGRLVGTLVDGYRNAGTYQTEFHAEGLASGVYLYHLSAGEHRTTGKMALMK
ncbi:FG-GAP repeat protein [bacterium]|nr:FG-GAP repeat protein [bacterium]